MKENRMDYFKIYTCKCGKDFIPTPNWMYKLQNKRGNRFYYCSYTCYRNDGGDNGKPTRQRV